MSQLMQRLRAMRGRFRRPVLGPIGSLISLTDDKWARAAEQNLGSILNTFIVDNPGDFDVFKVCTRSELYLCSVHSTCGVPANVTTSVFCCIHGICYLLPFFRTFLFLLSLAVHYLLLTNDSSSST